MTRAASDEARFVRPAFLPGVELVSVAYRNRSFPVHTHAEFVVGAVVGGAEILTARGENHLAAAGSTLFLHPDEPHANASVGDGQLRYRVFYLSTDAFMACLGDAAGLPEFAAPVSSERAIHDLVVASHVALSGEADQLEQDTTLLALAEGLAARGTQKRPPQPAGRHKGVERAKDFIDANFAEGFSLAALAGVADLSAFHLLRSFKRQVGLTPLAYRNQLRVMEARRMLLRGRPVAETALEVGFADQSHLTRQFQRIIGVSPAAYAQQ